jgi:hypothetical protein
MTGQNQMIKLSRKLTEHSEDSFALNIGFKEKHVQVSSLKMAKKKT